MRIAHRLEYSRDEDPTTTRWRKIEEKYNLQPDAKDVDRKLCPEMTMVKCRLETEKYFNLIIKI